MKDRYEDDNYWIRNSGEKILKIIKRKTMNINDISTLFLWK